MLRRASFLGALVVVVGLTDCGIGSQCGAIIECVAPVKIDAQVPLGASGVAGLSLTLCRNGACSSGTLGVVTKLEGAFEVDVKTTTSADDSTTDIVFTPAFDGYSLSTKDVEDGDQLEVRVARGTTVILDNTRKIDFVHGSAGCRDGFCYQATYTVTPSSASNIECHTETCPSVAMQIGATFQTTDLATPIVAVFCRNGVCETGTRALFSTPNTIASLVIDADAGTVNGFSTISIESGADASSGFTLDIESFGFQQISLQDGDSYSLEVTQGATTLVDGSQNVTYDKTFPNGEQCDTAPCLAGKITF